MPGAWGNARPGPIGRVLIALSRRTTLGRGAARRRLAKALARVHPGPVDTHVWGAPVRLHPWKNVSERKALLRPDCMDPREHRLVASVMAERPSVFVDIGANAGLYSLGAALSSIPGGEILAIEPNRALLERFSFNLALARRHGCVARDVGVRPVLAALGPFDGEGLLGEAATEGTRRLSVDGASGIGERVAVRRLRSLLDEQGIVRIDLLKIDVEGSEDTILPPFFAAAPNSLWPRVVIIEHLARKAWAVDCIEDCHARGYSISEQTRNNTILKRHG